MLYYSTNSSLNPCFIGSWFQSFVLSDPTTKYKGLS